MGAILGLLPTLWNLFGDLPKVFAALGSIHQAVIDAESKTLSGADKMTAVLNDAEAAINDLFPQWTGTFDMLAKDVEGAVNEYVAFLNLFKNAAPAK